MNDNSETTGHSTLKPMLLTQVVSTSAVLKTSPPEIEEPSRLQKILDVLNNLGLCMLLIMALVLISLCLIVYGILRLSYRGLSTLWSFLTSITRIFHDPLVTQEGKVLTHSTAGDTDSETTR